MRINVRLAEPFWRVIGRRDLDIQLDANAQVKDLVAALCHRYPDLTREFSETPPTIFVGDLEASDLTLLEDGDQVHLVWPVAGG